MNRLSWAFSLSMLGVMVGCSGAIDASDVGEGEGAFVGKEATLHFVVESANAYGGYTVRLANGGTFACPGSDDTTVQADRCTVADVSFAGYDEATQAKALDALKTKKALVEGTIATVAKRVTLDATATFVAAAGAPLEAGKYYSLRNAGRVCITAPCNDKDARELGSSVVRPFADPTFAMTGGTDEVAAATAALSRRNGGVVFAYGNPEGDHGFEVREVFVALAKPATAAR